MLHITVYDHKGDYLYVFNDAGEPRVRAYMAEAGFTPVASSSPRAVWGLVDEGVALVTDDEEDISEARLAGPITAIPAAVRSKEIEYRSRMLRIRRERAGLPLTGIPYPRYW